MILTERQLNFVRSLSVERLANMPNEQFDGIVDDEIRRMEDGEDREQLQKLLLNPRVRDRWHLVLIGIKTNVEGQLGYKKADLHRFETAWRRDPTTHNERLYLEKKEAFNTWRGGVLRFKNGVQDRIDKVRKARFGSISLTDAILSHKQKVLLEFAPDEVSDADRQLWKTVEPV